MIDRLKAALLRWLKVPAEPQPPAGAPDSLRVFRAAPNFWRLRLVLWSLRQLSTLGGVVFALLLLRSGLADRLYQGFPPARMFESVFVLLEAFGVALFLLQLPFSYLLARLDFELRWYLVTDRSLRIRSGVWTVEELTMTYANVQELTIHQNPWQRLLGIADLRVRSAGGGAGPAAPGSGAVTHAAFFHGVGNAAEIRDLIQEHLRRCRDTGLGDPETPAVEPSTPDRSERLAAAQELLAAARSLRTPRPVSRAT